MKTPLWMQGVALSILVCDVAAADPNEREPENPQANDPSAAPHVVPRHFLRADGRRIESGLRIETLGERVRVARRVFPQGGEPRGTSLPSHLGGGYLFYQPVAVDGSTYTAFYRSRTWTGDLEPLGRLPFAVHYVAPGFDRVYVMGVSLQAAFDPQTGDFLPLSPLPALPTITGVAFLGPRRALVSGPLVGVLYTGDAGLTWKKVPNAEAIQVDLKKRHLFVQTASGLLAVDEYGEAVPVGTLDLERADVATVDFDRLLAGHVDMDASGTSEDGGSMLEPATRDLHERQWVSLLTRGVPFEGHAWAIDDGQLLKLSLDDTLELQSVNTGVSPLASCIGTSKAAEKPSPPLFICQGDRLQVFRLTRGKTLAKNEQTLDLVWESGTEQRLLDWGDGGALFSGDCNGQPNQGVSCHVGESGARTLRLPKKLSSDTRSFAFATTSRGCDLMWFEQKASVIKSGSMTPAGGKTATIRSWKLPSDHAISDFLRQGTMLPRASRTREGLSFWTTHRERFVGVLLGDGDKPSFGPVQRPLRRAIFDGPRAMLWGAAGFAKQTTDGGQTFEEIALPYRSGDAELAIVDHARSAVVMGCSAVGCSLGRLLKLGWRVPKTTEEQLPRSRPFLIPGASRLRFTCGSAMSSSHRRESDEATFPGFWDKRPPTLTGGDEGSSVGFPGEVARLYAWGPADGAWSRTGRAQVLFVDPWDVTKVRSSAPTLQLFSSSLDAKTRLGLVDRSSGFRFLSMDPDGRAGVMLLRGASTTELIAFEEGKPLELFSGAHELGHRNLAGAVQAHSSFVAAFHQGSTFSLVHLSGGAVQPFADFNLGESGERGIQLVRSVHGDLGIAIEGDSGLFVYPVSPAGDLGQPTIVPHGSVTATPCAPEARGFIVDRDLAVAPYIESSEGESVAVSRVRAKMIVGYGRACIQGLRAQGRGLTEISGSAPASASIPLSILNSDSDGERSQAVCE